MKWESHFSKLLNGNDVNTDAEFDPSSAVSEDGVELSPPDYDEVL